MTLGLRECEELRFARSLVCLIILVLKLEVISGQKSNGVFVILEAQRGIL